MFFFKRRAYCGFNICKIFAIFFFKTRSKIRILYLVMVEGFILEFEINERIFFFQN